MRAVTVFAILALLLAGLLPAATLEKLSLDDMVQKSTAIVRARVLSSYAQQQGAIIYTHYRIQVSEWWKGSGPASADVVVPGGSVAGMRQTFSGSPQLAPASEHVLFLWTSARGLTHIIGLSQGLFDLTRDANGDLVATRAASSETMIDRRSGRSVGDEPLSFRLSELRQRVTSGLAAGGHK